MKYIWTKWCIFDDCLCVCYLTLHDYSSLVEGERHGILLLLLLLPILIGELCFECVKQVFAVRQGCGLYALMGICILCIHVFGKGLRCNIYWNECQMLRMFEVQ